MNDLRLHLTNMSLHMSKMSLHIRNLKLHLGNMKLQISNMKLHLSNMKLHLSNMKLHLSNMNDIFVMKSCQVGRIGPPGHQNEFSLMACKGPGNRRTEAGGYRRSPSDGAGAYRFSSHWISSRGNSCQCRPKG